jgi:hypothetical protein
MMMGGFAGRTNRTGDAGQKNKCPEVARQFVEVTRPEGSGLFPFETERQSNN